MSFPVDGKWISATEQLLGVRFPASFVAAMTKLNGGCARIGDDEYELYSFLDQTDRKRIARTSSSICRETAAMREWEHFQQELVVIGHNGTGDLLVFAPRADDPTILQHTVYWWDHERSRIESVADDFADVDITSRS